MTLDWMGDYREIVEGLIRYCNVYSAVYNKEIDYGIGVAFSFAQIQVVEYLLENEENRQNMSALADRLGVTYPTFSKLVSRLVAKGLLEKYHIKGNRKDVIVRVSPAGRTLYETYSTLVYREHFSKMFAQLEGVPPQYLHNFAAFFTGAAPGEETPACSAPPELVPVEQDKTK